LTYPRIGLNYGGLQIQIDQTIKGLNQLGVETIRYDPWQNQIPEVDVCHAFSIDGSMIYHIERATIIRKPVVVSPVLNLFKTPLLITQIKTALSDFVPGFYSDLKRAKKILKAAARVIALNKDEQRLLKSIFGISENLCIVVPNGIDTRFSGGDPELFESKYGFRDFLLEVASIEKRKNQLNLIRAMKDLPYRLVLVGKATSEKDEYLMQCKREAGDNVFFVEAFAHDDPMLAAAYAAAKLFVLPSYSEVMPLALYEAASAGCNVITSNNVPIPESMNRLVSTFDPEDTRELATLISHVMEIQPDHQLQDTVRAMPTWNQISEQILTIYQAVI
jgi:glycosyltransferase involved in cell wall biosynthesis